MELPFVATQKGNVGHLILGRKTSNVPMTLAACESVSRTLRDWALDDSIELVLVSRFDHASKFSARKDAITLCDSTFDEKQLGTGYLQKQMELCHLIGSYPKPYISVVDGPTVGVGIGVSLLGSHTVVTENAHLAFPETGFGSVPHGGAMSIMSRLPRNIGVWMALTGERLSGRNLLSLGLATHFCSAANKPQLLSDILEHGLSALNRYQSDADFRIPGRLEELEDAFGRPCAQRIFKRLRAGSAWGRSQASKLAAKSPLSSHIALRQARTAIYLDSLKASLKIEYRIMSRLIHTHNFREGVRATLKDMDYWPDWNVSTLHEVSGDMVSKYFNNLGPLELRLDDIERVCLVAQ